MKAVLSLLIALVAAGLCVQEGSSFVLPNSMILGRSACDVSRQMSAAAEVPTLEEVRDKKGSVSVWFVTFVEPSPHHDFYPLTSCLPSQ